MLVRSCRGGAGGYTLDISLLELNVLVERAREKRIRTDAERATRSGALRALQATFIGYDLQTLTTAIERAVQVGVKDQTQVRNCFDCWLLCWYLGFVRI